MGSEQLLVYAGALQHDGKLVHVYYRVSDDNLLDDRAQLFAEQLGEYPIGSVCSFKVTGGGAQVVHTGSKFQRVFPDPDVVTSWQARHDAVIASDKAWGTKMASPLNALKPIREAYRMLDEERQGVLIAQVVRFIVDPVK
jgi:hypothetical protein